MGEKEWTLAMLKPDALARNLTGTIVQRLEQEGFRIIAIRKVRLSESTARKFYEIHQNKPFFSSLIRYITSGPVIAMVLERENAVAHLRKVMGATDPAQAEPGTIRHQFGLSIERNTIHGSDSPENAEREILFFFSLEELVKLVS